MRWLAGERLFTVLAGSRAHRRARRRPGVLAAAPRRAAHGQPRPTSSTRRRSTTASPTRSRRRRGSRRAATCASAARASDATPPPLSVVSDVSTSFLESQLTDDTGVVQVGDASSCRASSSATSATTLKKLDDELGTATIVNVSCARLIRVDFIAAGDLLNWVLARRSENRTVQLRRGAPAGGAVLRRDGHQRARHGQGAHRLSEPRLPAALRRPPFDRFEPSRTSREPHNLHPMESYHGTTIVSVRRGSVGRARRRRPGHARQHRRQGDARARCASSTTTRCWPASPAPPPTPSRCSSASRPSSRSTRATWCAPRSS